MKPASQKTLAMGGLAGLIMTIGGLAVRSCTVSNPLLAAPWCGDAGASHSMLSFVHCSGCYAAAAGVALALSSLALLATTMSPRLRLPGIALPVVLG